MPEKPSNIDTINTAIVERFETDKLEVVTIGKPLNGRLLYSTPKKAEELYAGTEKQRKDLLRLLSNEASRHGVTKLFVLRVDNFNASIATPPDLANPEPEDTDNGVTLVRADDPTFFHDGIALQPGEGAVIVTGDCHTLTIWSTVSDVVVAAHAGRDSLHTLNPKRQHINNIESVVYSALDSMHTDPQHTYARITAGINGEDFDHPLDHSTHGEHNKNLRDAFAKYGAADIDASGGLHGSKMIAGQLIAAGIPNQNISWDGLNTATDTRLWSNKKDETGRNTILVLNKG